MDQPILLRTAEHGCFQLHTNSWGQFIRQIPDPDANVQLEPDALKQFELRTDIERMPAALWQRWIQLCFELTRRDSRNLEVSCRLLRHENDKSQWRICIPPQEVSGASVHADNFDGSIDIETGEVITQWPPTGWVPCGSSHSHNTMAAFFSGTDDKFELGDPGLHIVVGTINLTNKTYSLKASVTADSRRFIIDHNAVIDTAPIEEVSYHPSVLDIIQIETASAYSGYAYQGNAWAQHPWRTRWGRQFGWETNADDAVLISSDSSSEDWEAADDFWQIEQLEAAARLSVKEILKCGNSRAAMEYIKQLRIAISDLEDDTAMVAYNNPFTEPYGLLQS